MLVRIYEKMAGVIRHHPLVKRHPKIKEAIKYSLAGNMSNIFDFVFYIYLTRLNWFWQAHYISANIIAMLLAGGMRFSFHKFWTFRDESAGYKAQLLKFFMILFICLLLNLALIVIMVEFLSINDLLAKLAATFFSSLFVYYITRVWVFKSP